MNRVFIIYIAFIILFLSCDESKYTPIERKEEPTIYSADSEDEIMNKAVLNAKRTLNTFDSALISKDPLLSEFSMKSRFDAEGGGEHLWINDITIRNGNYFGVVNNEPEFTDDVKIGDSVEINKETITDWMYLENGVLRGGYTIRAIRDQMSIKERKAFDSEIGFKIEN